MYSYMRNKKDDKPHYLPTFMSIGISIGAAIGVATNNFPLYMLVGLALGVGIGSALDGQNRNRESDESQKDNEE